MNELVKELNVENMIYEIRGKQVMLDSDLAKLYRVETKRINEAVNRNKEKFPERYSFILCESDILILKSQFATSNVNGRGGNRYSPRVFTEQGVAMLATVLRSKTAIEVSIKIMDAFVAMRKYISGNLLEQKYINNLVMKHEDEINKIFTKLETKENELKNEIFFDGQIYDAYSKIIDILKNAKNDIIIIDSYADKYVLDMISKVELEVNLIISSKSRLSNLDIDKYNYEYNNLTIKYNDSFHDRFIILDKKIMYHLGTSLNNAGTKVFAINKIEDEMIISMVLNKIVS